ncbi:MAG: hypothetical protein HOQ05_03160 [Corynebacteriales bacterium]|nr:hypothetical protein [Mycobacteriales bacterium]
MTASDVSPPRIQELLALSETLIRQTALPILSRGYAELVASFRQSAPLADVARRDGIDAVLTSEDPIIEVLYKKNKELATGAEKAAEAAIGTEVLKVPQCAILGEELGERVREGAETESTIYFVLDPVDGTTSMARWAVAQAFELSFPDSVPAFGITIGLLDIARGEAVGGVVAQLEPHSDGNGLSVSHVWTGGEGMPAMRDNEIVLAAAPAQLSGATLSTTVPEAMFHDEKEWRDFQALHEATRRFVPGQNCIGFMHLLEDRSEATVVFERDLLIPDTAALAPILAAGGVRVTDIAGEPLKFGQEQVRSYVGSSPYEYVVLAAHPLLHDAAVRRIQAGPTLPSTFGQWQQEATGVDVRKTVRG